MKKGKCIAGLLVISLILVSLQEHVSLLAHLGGFISGLLFGLMVLSKTEKDELKETATKIKKAGTISFIVYTVILFGIWL